MIEFRVKGIQNLQRLLKTEGRRYEKALNDAIRVEAFRLKELLQKEIRAGRPGGRSLQPLSIIARKKSRRKPLARLALGVRYQVRNFKPFETAVGWVGPSTRSSARAAREVSGWRGRGISPLDIGSKRWRYLAGVHQEGFVTPVTGELRTGLARYGARLSKGSAIRKYFFLRKETRRLVVPARPILDPFWDAHGREAWPNIRKNFKRKLKGERI